MPHNDIKVGSKVKFNQLEGVVTNLEGYLVNVRFTGNDIKILEINTVEKLPDEGIGLGLPPDSG